MRVLARDTVTSWNGTVRKVIENNNFVFCVHLLVWAYFKIKEWMPF